MRRIIRLHLVDIEDEEVEVEDEDEDENEDEGECEENEVEELDEEEEDEDEEEYEEEECDCDDCIEMAEETEEESKMREENILRHRKHMIDHIVYSKHQMAAEKGDLNELMRLQRKTGTVGNSYICYMAAAKGHLDIVKYMHSQGLELTNLVSFKACISGNLALLQYLYDNKCPWHQECISTAVENEHLNAVEYLLKHDAPKDDRALTAAIACVNLEIVKLLHSHGYELHKEHVHAVFKGYSEEDYSSCICKEKDEETYLEILKYILSHLDCKNTFPFRIAMIEGKLKMAKWLINNGYPTVYVDTNSTVCEYFQHKLGISKCYQVCGHCVIERIKISRKVLYNEMSYGNWLSANIIERLIDKLY